MRNRTILAAATAASALAVSVLAAPPAAQGATPRSIPNTQPAWTAHARHLGNAANSSTVSARIYLAPRGGMAALQRTAQAVSTPGSAQYAKFLTPTQYYAQFAPTAATVRSVSAWLRSSGLRVSSIAAHNRYLAVVGTVAAARKAFSTQIQRFVKDGATVQAPATTLKAPAQLAPSVLTVTGLDTSPHKVQPTTTQDAPPPPGFHVGRPCSRYYGQLKATTQADFSTPLPKYKGQTLDYAPCGYTGTQFRGAYEGDTNLDGSGVTVAITDAYAAPTIKSDVTTYARNHGDAAYAPGQFTQTKPSTFTHGATCDPSGWYGEETLDVESVHAMAQGANIHYYAAASCNDSDFLDTLAQVVADDDAQLVTNSWGDVESAESTDNVAAYEQVFLQGATEGISFMYSSGDSGDERAASGLMQADYPTSDPYVTSVGGTSTAIRKDNTLSFQTGWGTDRFLLSDDAKSWQSVGFSSGAGGGTSTLFSRPAYQKNTTTSPYRQDPDVAMDADPTTGMLIGETQTFPNGVYYDEYRLGGTSLASPLFAGMTALALQRAGHGAGLLNPTIYSHKLAFNDVKGVSQSQPGVVRVDYANQFNASGGLIYSVRTFNDDSTFHAGPGYDLVTGVGVPNPRWFNAIPAEG